MTYSPLPERIETERLVMTPQVPSDAGWLADVLTARGAGPVTADDAAVRIAAMQALVAEHGIGARVLRPREGGDALGYCAIVVGRASLDEPELAYELLPAAHGHGYATEGSRALVAAAFATGRTRLWSTVRPWNTASLRVLDRVGFRRSHTTSDVRGEIVWHVLDRGGHSTAPRRTQRHRWRLRATSSIPQPSRRSSDGRCGSSSRARCWAGPGSRRASPSVRCSRSRCSARSSSRASRRRS